MATVFMKWLETSPGDYDRGIRLLTLGRIAAIKREIAEQHVQAGDRVLEIGCGTGTLAVMMAERGAEVVGIDVSPAMLSEAETKVETEKLDDQVYLHRMDASEIDRRFDEASFDVIVSTLVFSELSEMEQRHVLEAGRRLLKPGGRLVLADEVVPQEAWSRLLFYAIRVPLIALTWLLTRTTTTALGDIDQRLEQAGFRGYVVDSHLAGSLQLLIARPTEEVVPAAAEADGTEGDGGIETCCLPCAMQSVAERMTTQRASSDTLPAFEAQKPKAEATTDDMRRGIQREVPRLHHEVSLRTLLLDLWTLLLRFIPPYPKVEPGLYRVGEPDRSDPVLVTGNYDLTVRRLLRVLDGRVDCWLLVADSGGINVWCAAGGDHFTADDVIAAVRASGVEGVVDHHALVLPQLCANGVDGWRIRKELKWGVHWGPARADDIPSYLDAGGQQTDAMRWVDFPLRDRLEMTVVMLAFYGLLMLIPLFLFWRHMVWPVMAATTLLSLVYGLGQPWIPGRDGLAKGAVLAVITAGLVVGLGTLADWPMINVFNRVLGYGFLAFFVGSEYQGMSPLMRGEQANWNVEAVAGAGVLATYLLMPYAVQALGG